MSIFFFEAVKNWHLLQKRLTSRNGVYSGKNGVNLTETGQKLSFYKRLGYAISKNLVDKRGLDLLSDLAWSATFIRDLCDEIERQAMQHGESKPSWLKYVRQTLKVVPIATATSINPGRPSSDSMRTDNKKDK